MASRAGFVRTGEEFVLRVLASVAKPGATVRIEEFTRLAVQGTKRPLRRFYDFVLNGVRYECKRWTFTPPGSGFFQQRAVRAANEQWIRDLAHVAQTEGTSAIAVRLRWVFPEALNAAQVRNHFVTILQDPAIKAKLTKYLGNNQALFSQVDTEVKRAINTLIEFH